MRLQDIDLVHAVYSARVNYILHNCPKEVLLPVIEKWFQHPLLKSPRSNTSFEDYTRLKTKIGIYDRLVHDWPDGLTLYQIAQLDLSKIMNNDKLREMKLWKMKPKGTQGFKKTMTLEQTRDRMQELLGAYYKCHVFAQHHDEQGTDWIRISIYNNARLEDVPTTYDTCFIIRYPETPFVVRVGPMTAKRTTILQQVIVQTFDARTIVEENISGKSLPRLDHYVKNHASLGAASQLRVSEVDPKPLEFSSPSKKRPAEEQYVKSREQRRRIVPLHHEVLDSRKRHVANTFGVDVAQGVDKLELHMESSLEGVVDDSLLQSLPYPDLQIKMDVAVKGSNVMDGLRALMLSGHIDTPVPSWLVAVATQGINKAHIKGGEVMKEVVEDVDSEDDEDDVDREIDEERIYEASLRP